MVGAHCCWPETGADEEEVGLAVLAVYFIVKNDVDDDCVWRTPADFD